MINENQKIIEAYEESVIEEGLIRRLGSKVFGGDINKHTQEMYNLILDYLKKNSLNT